jgi:hypothetical protein
MGSVASLLIVGACLFAADQEPRALTNLKQARKKYEEQLRRKLDKAMALYDATYKKKLEALKVTLTKKGDLEGALAVKAELDALKERQAESRSSAGIKSGKLARVSVKNAKLLSLRKGAAVFGDESRYVWAKIPKAYSGLKYWRPDRKHQALTEMTVKADGMVYIAVIERSAPNARTHALKDWKILPFALAQTDGTKWIVFSKVCKKGETFSLRPDKYCAPIPLQ